MIDFAKIKEAIFYSFVGLTDNLLDLIGYSYMVMKYHLYALAGFIIFYNLFMAGGAA